jgi:Xaa-Pro aminopeptidase
MNISHRVRRGVSGRLHEETNYGAVYERTKGEPREKRTEGEFVVRKPVEALSMNEVAKIRDEAIKQIVIKQLEKHGIETSRSAAKVAPKKMQEAMKGLAMPSGVPIRKVRILKSDETIRPIREAAVLPVKCFGVLDFAM